MNRANSNTTLPKTQKEFVVGAGEPIAAQFSWLHPDIQASADAEFCALVKDVTSGCKTILDLLHSDTLDRSADRRAVLSIQQTEYLMLMAARSVEMLGWSSERRIDQMNDHARAKQDDSAAAASGREASPA